MSTARAIVLSCILTGAFMLVSQRWATRKINARQRQRDLICNCLGGISTVTHCWLDTGERLPIDAARELCAVARALQ